jgi:hypothetical protein
MSFSGLAIPLDPALSYRKRMPVAVRRKPRTGERATVLGQSASGPRLRRWGPRCRSIGGRNPRSRV